jgi:transcriptional regulator with GAF, ATPase, and Fis domain
MQQTSVDSQAYLIIQHGRRWTDILRLQTGRPVIIGRASENDVVVQDERVSRRHAQLDHHEEGWRVRDLNSRNGTQVGGKRINGDHRLVSGQVIEVGGCRLTFTDSLLEAFPAAREQPCRNVQQTLKIDSSEVPDRAGRTGEIGGSGIQEQDPEAPAIVNRLMKSQWSAELDPNQLGISLGPDKWNFFYRLIFELVSCDSAERAASLALTRVLDELGLSAGGVIRIDQSEPESETGEYRMALLATHQLPGRSYHRLSDYLVRTVLREGQAILARNVRDHEQLSAAQRSGQHDTTSVLCAPLKEPGQSDSAGCGRTIGLLHVYSQSDQKMLTDEDLHLVVGVADSLSIALAQLDMHQRLTEDLDRTRKRASQLEDELHKSSELVGQSPLMQQLQTVIRRAGPTDATVLIRGESGVGKELVARAIHQHSLRKEGPLVCLNCAALAPSLLESELFGHEKGAFTGATDRKIGKFESAHRGTLLLDEIGEMPHELQAKFLRVLEGHPFERLGGNNPIRSNVRVIAATNRDLEEAVRSKEFRSDLYFRLRVVEVFVPPLRQRPDDIPLLVEHFLKLLSPHAHRRLLGIEPDAMQLLLKHSWPGNVRELRNVLERAVVLGTHSTIALEDLSLSAIGVSSTQLSGDSTVEFQPISLSELEKKHIMAMLDYVDGNKSKAAQLLGIERSTLDRKLKRF